MGFHLQAHTPLLDYADEGHGACDTWTQNCPPHTPTLPGFENLVRTCRAPPKQILKFDRSSSRTKIIDRFILTTVLTIGHMET